MEAENIIVELCEHHKDPETRKGREIIYTDDLGYKYCSMCIGNLFDDLRECRQIRTPTFLMSEEEEKAFHWALGRDEIGRQGEKRDILSNLFEKLKLGAPDFPIIQIQKEEGEPDLYKLEGEMALEVGACYEVVLGDSDLYEFILIKSQGDTSKFTTTKDEDIPETLPRCPLCKEEMIPNSAGAWKCEQGCNIVPEINKFVVKQFLER